MSRTIYVNYCLAQVKVTKEKAKNAFKELAAIIGESPTSTLKIIFNLYFDEAHTLMMPTCSGTFSKSARVRSSIRNLQAPITETPFDCSPDFPGILGIYYVLESFPSTESEREPLYT